MFPRAEPVGQIYYFFYESRATICDNCQTQLAFKTGKVCENEQLVPATNRWYYIIAQPVKDLDGKVVNVLEGITDITERKRAEEQIQKLNEELEQRVVERTKELENKRLKLQDNQRALVVLLEDMNEAKKELEAKIAESERLNKVFVGRELRMIELKERIKELEKQIGSSSK